MKNNNLQGFSAVILLILVGFVVLGMVAFIYSKTVKYTPQTAAIAPTSTADAPTPTIAMDVKDYAPNLPMAKKTTLVIRHSDSSESKYYVPTVMIDTFIRSLPPGDAIVSKSQ